MIVDSHCHLNMKEFSGEGAVEKVVAAANAAGIKYMQTICTKLEDIAEIVALTEKFPCVFGSVGVHPHDASQIEDPDLLLDQLVDYASFPKIIGIGETGLDYYYEYSDRAEQQEVFKAHIMAAQAMYMPVIVHTRDANSDTMQILKEEMRRKEFPGLIHCFSSSRELAMQALDLGMYISISGIVTFKNADELRSIIADVPLNRLLVETDSPYLAPVPMRGKRNEPAFTRYVVETIAEIKNKTFEEISNVTTENFFTLFAKAVK